MSGEKDMIQEALARANTSARIRAFKNTRAAAYTSKRKYDRLKDDYSSILRPSIRKAKQWFREALIPRSLRQFVWIDWRGDGDAVLDYADHTAMVWLSYSVHVSAMTLSGQFCPKSRADCEAEAWRVFGVVAAILKANVSRYPAEIQIKIGALS